MSKMLELAYRDSEVAVNNVVKCIVEMGLAYRNVWGISSQKRINETAKQLNQKTSKTSYET